MKNLLNCNGRRFAAKIAGTQTRGRIRVIGDEVFLCQDDVRGCSYGDRFSYKYSWAVYDGSPSKLSYCSVTDFKLIAMTAEGIEAYKDWQVGDKINRNGHLREVIFRSGELVVCKELCGGLIVPLNCATGNYTCDGLYNVGFRLVAESAPEEEEVVEVTMDEIAKMKGVAVERIRVKKEE